jgi:hypothetical protein
MLVVPAYTLTKEERTAFLTKKPCFKMTTAEVKIWMSLPPGQVAQRIPVSQVRAFNARAVK